MVILKKKKKKKKEGEIKRAGLKHGILTLQIFKLRDYDCKCKWSFSKIFYSYQYNDHF
jgi:hypothetical protein